MYNLFVSSNDDAWDCESWVMEKSRCITEYSDQALINRYAALTPENISELKRYPCIFAYEGNKNPRFGKLRNVIAARQNNLRIEYQIMDIEPFITAADIKEMSLSLDIDKWEMSRTHWAVKDVDLPLVLRKKDVILPSWTQMTIKPDIKSHFFKVSLSFPGEFRSYVESVAKEVEILIGQNSCFYDNNYIAQLARPQLDLLLQDIYRNRSGLVVVFLCSDYQNKKWCGVEFRAIREIIMDKLHERVMFVRMDNGEVHGVFNTDGYINGCRHSPSDVAGFIQERVDLLNM